MHNIAKYKKKNSPCNGPNGNQMSDGNRRVHDLVEDIKQKGSVAADSSLGNDETDSCKAKSSQSNKSRPTDVLSRLVTKITPKPIQTRKEASGGQTDTSRTKNESDTDKPPVSKSTDNPKQSNVTIEKQNRNPPSGQCQPDTDKALINKPSEKPKQSNVEFDKYSKTDIPRTDKSKGKHLSNTDSGDDEATGYVVIPEKLSRQYRMACEKFEYFWDRNDVFSQWYHSSFFVDGLKFNCAEQFMMYNKAVIADDLKTADRIMSTSDPRLMKRVGRKIQTLSYSLWQSKCIHVVKQGNIAKFSQNKELKRKLFQTYPKILVEASPYDDIWGIGLYKTDPRAWDQGKWQGTNWLGFVLTEVRDELMCDDKIIEADYKKVYIDDL